MVSKVLLAEPRGFCAGVEMAIKALTWMVQVFDAPVYCYHEIVHNAAVVGVFERAGVVFVDDVSEVPAGRPVMLSAHGSAPDVVAGAERLAAVMVDAVCPLVTKVGHHGHDEAIGVVAEAPQEVTLVDPRDGEWEVAAADPSRVALLAQTTLGLYEWEGVLAEAQDRYPGLWTARKSDLCYATTNRQTAVQELCRQADLILVVGSENSSNTKALVRVAAKSGVPAHRVEGPEAIDPDWLKGTDVIGVTAGASAPDHRVQAVIDAIAPSEGIELVGLTDEDEYFPLPPQLRRFLGVLQALVEGAFAVPRIGEHGPMDRDRDWTASEALALLGQG
jgi:4-hydroxy-3-methylbut-2-enyl diphosphate reductase